MPNLDAIVVPVGGGGMLSGICIAAKSLKPDIEIYAAEPLNADDCAKSFASNTRIPLPGKYHYKRLINCPDTFAIAVVGESC